MLSFSRKWKLRYTVKSKVGLDSWRCWRLKILVHNVHNSWCFHDVVRNTCIIVLSSATVILNNFQKDFQNDFLNYFQSDFQNDFLNDFQNDFLNDFQDDLNQSIPLKTHSIWAWLWSSSYLLNFKSSFMFQPVWWDYYLSWPTWCHLWRKKNLFDLFGNLVCVFPHSTTRYYGGNDNLSAQLSFCLMLTFQKV